jgi:rhodanese-related sulfurtransferase
VIGGEVAEYNRGHVPGAVFLPLGSCRVIRAPPTAGSRRDVPVYVVCSAGNRSLIATGMLIHAGYAAFGARRHQRVGQGRAPRRGRRPCPLPTPLFLTQSGSG